MRQTLALAIVVLLSIVGCSSKQVFVDFDREADFGSFKTFAWQDTSELSIKDSSPLMHQRIVDAIQSKLEAGGMKKVTSNPDVYVTYHTNERQEMRLNTTSFGYGWGGSSWQRSPHWGASSSHTTVQQFTRGTLVVDIWSAATKNLVWRGTVENVISDNPDRVSQQILDAVDSMVREWERQRARQATSG